MEMLPQVWRGVMVRVVAVRREWQRRLIAHTPVPLPQPWISCSESGRVLHGLHRVHPLNGYVLGTVDESRR